MLLLVAWWALVHAEPSRASTSARASDNAALAARYAPVFYFDKDERYWPISIRSFIRESTLKFVESHGCVHKIAGAEARNKLLKASRLGVRSGNPYTARRGMRRVRKAIRCSPKFGPTFRATQFTRPGDKSLRRPSKLPSHTGFVLDLDNDKRRAWREPTSSTPLYYLVRRTPDGGQFIRYFLMYTCSAVGVRMSRVPETLPPGGGVAKWCAHEGEWEGLSVYVPPDGSPRPFEVYYNEHFDGTRVIGEWNVLKNGEHPRGYVARGTHATYQYPGERVSHDGNGKDRGYDEARGNGVVWRPAKLVDVVREPWYGFGGAWGDLGPIAALTGPLGPGPRWKIRAAGFPSPYMWNPPAFPAQAIRWCQIANYPNTDQQCVRPLHDEDTFLSGRSLTDLDLDCPDATTGEALLPDHFFNVVVNPPYPDEHGLDGDRNGVGCENERSAELRHWEWAMPTTPARTGDLWLDFDARENQEEILMQIRFYVGDPAQCFAQVREYAEATARRAADGTYAASGTIKAEAAPGVVYSQGTWRLDGSFSAPGHFTGTIKMNLTNDPSINGCAEPTETYDETFDAVPSK